MIDNSIMLFMLVLYCSFWSLFLTGIWTKIVAISSVVALVEGVLSQSRLDSIIGGTNVTSIELGVLVVCLGGMVHLWNKDRIRISREDARAIALKYLASKRGVEKAEIDTMQDVQKEELVNGEWHIPTVSTAFKLPQWRLIIIDARTGKVVEDRLKQ